MSQTAIIGIVGLMMVVCSSSSVAMFMTSGSSGSSGSSGVQTSPGGFFKLYSGCDYDGDVLQSVQLGPVETSKIDNLKGEIKTEHWNTLPPGEQEKLVFKSVEIENMELKGDYISMGVLSSEKKDFNNSGTKKISFCNPDIQEYGATKLNLTWKLLGN